MGDTGMVSQTSLLGPDAPMAARPAPGRPEQLLLLDPSRAGTAREEEEEAQFPLLAD